MVIYKYQISHVTNENDAWSGKRCIHVVSLAGRSLLLSLLELSETRSSSCPPLRRRSGNLPICPLRPLCFTRARTAFPRPLRRSPPLPPSLLLLSVSHLVSRAPPFLGLFAHPWLEFHGEWPPMQCGPRPPRASERARSPFIPCVRESERASMYVLYGWRWLKPLQLQSGE